MIELICQASPFSTLLFGYVVGIAEAAIIVIVLGWRGS